MQGSSSLPHGKHYEMNRALVIGNGESREWFNPRWHRILDDKVITWGCNAIHRDCVVDNLVVIDYAMQQEVYQSEYAFSNKCHFADWAILEDFDPEFLKMNLYYGHKCRRSFFNTKGFSVGTPEYKKCVMNKGRKN